MKVSICCLAFLAQSFVTFSEATIYARCKLRPNTNPTYPPSQNLHGTIWFEEHSGSTKISGTVTGFTTSADNAKHGFHIHTNADPANNCNDNGGHYNPDGVNHAAPTNTTKHVGDLGNIVVQSGKAAVGEGNQNDLVKLSGSTKVIGRSIVVHEGEDDLGLGGTEASLKTGDAGGRLACCVIEEYVKQKYTATCELHKNSGGSQDLKGTIHLVQNMMADTEAERQTKIVANITGFSTLDNYTKHGFHVHEKPPGTGYNCGAAAGHYSPEGRNHSGPTDLIRHYGDLGNIDESNGESFVQLSDNLVELFGIYSVVGRGFVVHEKKDDLGQGGSEASLKTGDAGGRLACCKIVDTTDDTISSANHISVSILSIAINIAAIFVVLNNSWS